MFCAPWHGLLTGFVCFAVHQCCFKVVWLLPPNGPVVFVVFFVW